MRDNDEGKRSERDRLAQQAAYLRARHNLTQEEIGRLLGGVSQSHVSRLLDRATEMGWLVTELRFDDRTISEEAMREIARLLEPKRLVSYFEEIAARTGHRTPTVRVFDSGSDAPTSGAFDLRCRRFGRSAAGRLDELLRRSRVVGVTWGRTVSSMVDGLTASNRSFSNDHMTTFVPVSAELITLAASAYSSTLLAGRLNTLVNQGEGEKLGLGGVPAYIPRRYDAAKVQAIREYLMDADSYRRIFAGEAPLINRLDTVITSVGSSDRPLGGAMGEVLSAADMTMADLKTLIVGDIGGILIPRRGATMDEIRLVDQINSMWTGITRDQLALLAERANSRGNPGVVVAAIGRERTAVIAELIRLEMVNELIIDWDLANALETHFTASEAA